MRSDARADRLRQRLCGPLPVGFDRWTIALGPGETRISAAAEWSGALILVDAGMVEVGCMAGARTTFGAGDVLALSCLPLRWLRNPGSQEARIVAIRRSQVGSSQ